eukprot:TRINITY_DN574_c0_g1_i1.p1 TRINITY_DN574_c0_g1~~TRINITY_DN574_c0_g1_i1.p1  ORF type:complete len:270 (+),score=29.61 TRINITY_DN574_c0_g1_i1:265-1074(+)
MSKKGGKNKEPPKGDEENPEGEQPDEKGKKAESTFKKLMSGVIAQVVEAQAETKEVLNKLSRKVSSRQEKRKLKTASANAVDYMIDISRLIVESCEKEDADEALSSLRAWNRALDEGEGKGQANGDLKKSLSKLKSLEKEKLADIMSLARSAAAEVVSPSVTTLPLSSLPTLKCAFCGKDNHTADSCFKRQKMMSQQLTPISAPTGAYSFSTPWPSQTSTSPRLYRCPVCKMDNHSLETCFKVHPELRRKGQQAQSMYQPFQAQAQQKT